MNEKQEYQLDSWWMPFTAQRQFLENPRIITAAKGLYMTTADGREVLDAMCGLMSTPCGHSRPEIAEAVYQQMQDQAYTTPFQHGHPAAYELSTRLRELTPDGLSHAVYGTAGSDATETALKIALAYQSARGEGSRNRLVGREKAYHGVNFGGMSVGGLPANRQQFGMGMPGVLHLRHTLIPENKFTLGEGEYGVELADDLQKYCDFYRAHSIAACIVEPVAGSAGVLPPPKGYLKRLREICDANGIVLIFDEVITGFGRTGEMFGSQRFDVTPDMICMAKGLTNSAIPMSAVMVSDKIYDTLVTQKPTPGVELFHGYTYSGHPAACAAALATLDIFENEDLVSQARNMESYFQEQIFSMKDISLVTDIRAIGLMAAVDLAPKEAPGVRGLEIGQAFFDAGVSVKFTGDTFLVGPSLNIQREQVDYLVDTLNTVLRKA